MANLPDMYVLILQTRTCHVVRKRACCFFKLHSSKLRREGEEPCGAQVCLAVLEGLDNPLLCTSAHVPDQLAPDTETPDLGSMLTAYA
eukprot:scaffold119961_cov22-Tisochrysis_lutea.AAC.1